MGNANAYVGWTRCAFALCVGEHCDWDRVAYRGPSAIFLVEDHAPDTSCTFRIRPHSNFLD